MFASLGDGNISISAYDTAWVARVPALDGRNSPQFPQCLDWIMKNQFQDGSWGDKHLFFVYERVCATLSCVIALKSWNSGTKHVQKALEFIRKTMPRLETEESALMPIGFEIVFTTMLEEAMELGIDLDYSSGVVKRFYDERKEKLARISIDALQTHPTPLLYSLEGFHKDIDWNKVVKLQSEDGSLLCSPASTACALMYTKNEKCLQYLENILKHYKDAVPNTYPVDLFERIWIVDRLEKLGIARHFKSEIKQALDYIYSFWSGKGISWARQTPVQDGDDTSMGFMVLRSHGYDVSAEVFKNFERENGQGFFCFPGQVSEAVTGMLDLYKATKVMFPGEEILERAREFSRSFLEEKRRGNDLHDKWVVMKDLPGEVEFELDNPMNATLERIATRSYIDQYGVDDVWIGKSLYRMPFVNNPIFLELAKVDFHLCQALHKEEFEQLRRWYNEGSFRFLGSSLEDLKQSFFGAAATIFEPELAAARTVWSRCSFIARLISEHFDDQDCTTDELQDLLDTVRRWNLRSISVQSSDTVKLLFLEILLLVEDIEQRLIALQRRSVKDELKEMWRNWLSTLLQRKKWKLGEDDQSPTLEEYMEQSRSCIEPAVRSTIYFLEKANNVNSLSRSGELCTAMNTAIVLDQDNRDYCRKEAKKLNCVNLYLEERPGASAEDALSHFEKQTEGLMRRLLYESMRSKASESSKLFLNGARIANFMARQEKVGGHIHKLLLQPVGFLPSTKF